MAADDGVTAADESSDGRSKDAETEVVLEHREAVTEVVKAVSGRRSLARKYVMRARLQNPDASPADLIRLIERHYSTAITAAGAALAVGAVAASVGVSLLPGGGAVAKGGKAATSAAMKVAGKNLLRTAAKSGGEHALAALVPAGDKQVQFEITALFALALAEIHELELDVEQSTALVRGLTDGDATPRGVADVAAGLARPGDDAGSDAQAWANTLATALPGPKAQEFVRSLASKEDVQAVAGAVKNRQVVNAGVGAIVGGAQRFVFGKAVVEAARLAFGPPPVQFPAALAVPVVEAGGEETDGAWKALEAAAQSLGSGVGAAAETLGAGLTTAAATVSRPFRSVDRDGDGIADAPLAVSAARDAGAAVAGSASAIGQRLTKPLVGLRNRRARDGSVAEDSSTSKGDTTLSQELRDLASLHTEGLLSDEEFAAAKAALLAR